MTVITISREFGSGGDLLAEKVAHALGYHLVDKAFVSAVLGQYGLAEFDSEYEKQPGFWEGFDTEKAERRDTMVRTLNQAVFAVARHGNVVILGRSGYAILAGLADVLHVRLQAPLEDRIEFVRQEQNVSLLEATALVKDKDSVRKAFIESFYRVPWDSSHAFDVALNMSRVPVNLATDWIVQAARRPARNLDIRMTSKQLEIDTVMQQAVAEKLKCETEHA
ncbi:MAG: cytidylate kinase-like family protein [Propionivibrio sp.]